MKSSDKESIINQLDNIEDIGELSDGYHTYNSLYYQRLILFATLVNLNPDISWKSLRHEDGELCFGGGWFIVGIDTPEGSYTYHYETKDFDLFKCATLERSKHWDGHTDKDVTRLLSLQAERPQGKWIYRQEWFEDEEEPRMAWGCNQCGFSIKSVHEKRNFCPNCGADMRKGAAE